MEKVEVNSFITKLIESANDMGANKAILPKQEQAYSNEVIHELVNSFFQSAWNMEQKNNALEARLVKAEKRIAILLAALQDNRFTRLTKADYRKIELLNRKYDAE